MSARTAAMSGASGRSSIMAGTRARIARWTASSTGVVVSGRRRSMPWAAHSSSIASTVRT